MCWRCRSAGLFDMVRCLTPDSMGEVTQPCARCGVSSAGDCVIFRERNKRVKRQIMASTHKPIHPRMQRVVCVLNCQDQ